MPAQDYSDLLAKVTSPQRERLSEYLDHEYQFFQDDVKRALYFLTSDDTKRLENEAFSFSQQCADMLNKYGAQFRELGNALKKLPESVSEHSTHPYPSQLMEFLGLFCIQEGGKARPLQPQTALAKLRSDPTEAYERFRTHSFPPFCLLDMVANDCSNASLLILSLLHSTLFKDKNRNIPPELATMKTSLSFDYDQLWQQFSEDILRWRTNAETILASCTPQQSTAQVRQA